MPKKTDDTPLSDPNNPKGVPGPTGAVNTYWDEPPPHPDPALGCIRRGLCCRSNPGWFGPGEAEEAAKLVGLEADDFVRRYLVVDWLDTDEGRVHVFAPAKLARDGEPLEPTGGAVSSLYGWLKGVCIFFKGDEEGCGIYGARPIECRRYICTNLPEDNLSHKEIAALWAAAADEQGA